jgi:hypothetical protein
VVERRTEADYDGGEQAQNHQSNEVQTQAPAAEGWRDTVRVVVPRAIIGR